MRKIIPLRIKCLLLCSVLFFVNDRVQAQHENNDFITINTDLVTTWTQIANRQSGLPVKRLKVEDFNLTEEGKYQQLSWVKEGQPLSVVILVDGMKCVAEPWYQRVGEIMSQFGEDDEISLMAWDTDAVLVQPLAKYNSGVLDKFKKRFDFFSALNPGPYGYEPHFGTKIVVRLDRTNYRPGEAIYQATQYLESAASPKSRKIIIVISSSNIEIAHKHMRTASEVETLLAKTSTTVFGLIHNEGFDSSGGKILKTFINPKRNLKGILSGTINHFVNISGGSTVTGEWEDCDEMFIKLAKQIRSSYTIGYYPDDTNFDGKFRRIKLELSKSGRAKFGNVDIKTREGYYAVRSVTSDVSDKSK